MSLANLVRAMMPEKMRAPLKRWVDAYIPIEKRMGRRYWQLRAFLQEAQWWDREHIEAWQLQKTKEIVRHAYENVPGYNALYREAGIKPEDIGSLADVRLLPFVTRDLLRDNLADFAASNIASWRRKYVTTGGSTGIPLGFYHTDINVWMERAFMHSGWEWVGWQLGDISAVLRGSFIGSLKNIWRLDPVQRELQLSSYHLTESTYAQYISVLQEFSPKHLQAYPSAITHFSDLMIQHGDAGRIGFKTILLGSENIYEWQMQKLVQAFPEARIFGWYGHTEQAVLAPMCEYSDYYHLWPFYGLTEIVNDKDEDTSEDEIGELVGTSFWSYGTPFIRYRTADLVHRGPTSCSQCNRQFQLLKRIEGRTQDFVVTIDGGYVTLTGLIFAQHFYAFGAIKNMQLYQDTIGEVIVRVVPTDRFTDQDSSEIKTKMETAVGGRLTIRVDPVDEIPRTQRGKYQFLEQKLDIKYGA